MEGEKIAENAAQMRRWTTFSDIYIPDDRNSRNNLLGLVTSQATLNHLYSAVPVAVTLELFSYKKVDLLLTPRALTNLERNHRVRVGKQWHQFQLMAATFL